MISLSRYDAKRHSESSGVRQPVVGVQKWKAVSPPFGLELMNLKFVILLAKEKERSTGGEEIQWEKRLTIFLTILKRYTGWEGRRSSGERKHRNTPLGRARRCNEKFVENFWGVFSHTEDR